MAILAITQGDKWGWSSFSLIFSFVLAGLLVTAFVIRSQRHSAPLFDLALFRLKTFSVGMVGTVFFMVAFFSWLISLPTFIQSVWGWSILSAITARASVSSCAYCSCQSFRFSPVQGCHRRLWQGSPSSASLEFRSDLGPRLRHFLLGQTARQRCFVDC